MYFVQSDLFRAKSTQLEQLSHGSSDGRHRPCWHLAPRGLSVDVFQDWLDSNRHRLPKDPTGGGRATMGSQDEVHRIVDSRSIETTRCLYSL